MATKVAADISMSLDGFVTGPEPGPRNGLGHGGEALHHWAIDSTHEVDTAVLREATEASGAVIMGRRLFDIVDGPDGWNDEMGYGASNAATPPFFVLTHQPPDEVRLPHQFTFVTDGMAAAVAQAKEAAGDREVVVMGGGQAVRQAVEQGLVDELRIHLAPVLLGGGTPLFDPAPSAAAVRLEQVGVRVSPHATHIVYRLRG